MFPDDALTRATTEHYVDPLLYDHEYRRRRADLNYYRAVAAGRMAPLPGLPAGREILELGCGTGRLLVPLLRDGYRVTGVDLSESMLARCRERVDRLAEGAHRRATLVRGDMRDLSLGRRFTLVLLPFNSMMHLYGRDDLERCLAVVRAHLAPGGLFCFDVLNPDLEWLMRDSSKRWARTRFKDPRTGRPRYYSTNHLYDQKTQINWIRLYYEDAPAGGAEGRGLRSGAGEARAVTVAPGDAQDAPERRSSRGAGARRAPAGRAPGERAGSAGDRTGGSGAGATTVVSLAQRQLFPVELVDLLHYNGFSVDAREGGFVGEPFESDSESQVCRCSIARPVRR